MREEFIPFEEALALKEVDFDEPCLAFWDAYDGMSQLFFKKRTKAHWLVRLFSKKNEEVTSYNQDSLEYFEDAFCLAPTFSQAFRWFRDNCGLYASIVSHDVDNHIFTIVGEKLYESDDEQDNFDTHKEAELACLRKLIEIVKTKQHG